MTAERDNPVCAAFQGQLAELIGSGEDIAAHTHYQDCERCQALLAELETIAEAARQLFPIVDPPEALWQQIESAIEKEEKGSDRH